ncbi:MAG TPA: hypothetical protein VN918_03780, partial [Myxococcaceae bacterium]|nr:hypothetical protein [Myxococcaceae bacterium]
MEPMASRSQQAESAPPPPGQQAEAVVSRPAQHPAADTTSLITGSEAIAVACKLADVDVITAYPIRPYDTVMQYVAKLVSNGELDCEYIVAESEHSQFEIV